MMTPKRRLLILIFTSLCIKKSFLIKILKRDNQLSLFRRLERVSKKQINCDGSIEFLCLCKNSDLTPTFAQVDKVRKSKWKKSSATFPKDVVDEELILRTKESAALKYEINAIYCEIRATCSLVRYISILRIMTILRRKFQQEVINTHTRKFTRLLYRETDIEEHIMNISPYKLSFFQKLVLCRGLKFALPQKVSPIDVMATLKNHTGLLSPTLKMTTSKS